jgi:hypothetical protein
MKKNNFIKLLSAAAIFSFVALPVLAFAQTQITISTSVPGQYNGSVEGTSPGAFIANIYQFALVIGGVLAFGVIVYGGIRYMTSAGNPSAASDAKEWIEAALLGLLLLAGAYFILSVVNPQLLNLNLPSLAPANVAAPAGGANGGGASTPVSTSGGTNGSNGVAASVPNTGCKGLSNSAGGSVSSQIAAASDGYCGASTANGPGGGTVSCAWAVNNVLAKAGIPALDSDSVQSMENALLAGRGTLVSPAAAQPGDIVIQAQDGHVGICQNVGCTLVLSNSSSKASFTWLSNTSFSQSYHGGPGRIYQLNK